MQDLPIRIREKGARALPGATGNHQRRAGVCNINANSRCWAICPILKPKAGTAIGGLTSMLSSEQEKQFDRVLAGKRPFQRERWALAPVFRASGYAATVHIPLRCRIASFPQPNFTHLAEARLFGRQ